MSEKNIQEKIQKLSDAIRRHDRLYYIENRTEISDSAYDKLFKELEALEREYPSYIAPDSPTQRVSGQASDSLKKFKHPIPLLSLQSLFEEDEILAFDSRIKKELGLETAVYTCEPKYDGLSLEIVYKDGFFLEAGTRGDGTTGEDVTHNVRTIKNLPLKLESEVINLKGIVRLRAEALLTINGFNQMNKELVRQGKEPFANPRNAASGTLRQLDQHVAAKRPLQLFFYDLLSADNWEVHSHWECLQSFKELGLLTSPLIRKCHHVKDIMNFHQDIFKERDNLNYEIDGIVIKLDDFALREKLGTRARSPKWACALKFESRKEVTHLEGIDVQVGRQGTLTPVAILRPVDVGGVTVSRASLHNEDLIKKLDLSVGDMVRVARAGDVIPEVVEVVKRQPAQKRIPFQMPHKCPACNAPVHKDGAYWFCTAGYKCPAQMKWSIIHFASKRAMNIEGLGKETVELLTDKEIVRDVADIYELTFSDFENLEGFKDKKINNLLRAIEASKEQTASRCLFGLGIRHVGEEVARLLLSRFGSIQSLYQASEEDITSVKGIGPQIAQSCGEFFSKDENLILIDRLKQHGLCMSEKIEEYAQGPLMGTSLVFTGELSKITRDEAKKMALKLGAKVTSAVSSKTSYVVAGENPGSKYKKALELNVSILSEDEFLKIAE